MGTKRKVFYSRFNRFSVSSGEVLRKLSETVGEKKIILAEYEHSNPPRNSRRYFGNRHERYVETMCHSSVDMPSLQSSEIDW